MAFKHPLNLSTSLNESRLNLPPLRLDQNGQLDQTQLDHFHRTIQEWGHEVDKQLQQATAEALAADVLALTERVATLEEQVAILDAALPRGIVERFPYLSTPVSVGAAATAICGTLDYTFVKGRRYRIVCYVRAIESAAAHTGDMQLYDGSTVVSTFGGNAHFDVGAANYGMAYAEWIVQDRDIRYAALHIKMTKSATTNVHVGANSQFYIEDTGVSE